MYIFFLKLVIAALANCSFSWKNAKITNRTEYRDTGGFSGYLYIAGHILNFARWVQNWPGWNEKLISDEDALEKRVCGKRPQKKTLERLSQMHEKVDMAIQEYDLMRILVCWLVELTGFSVFSSMHAGLPNGYCQK